jgi:glycosyltransferase involved in cell wall biosynthesis
MPRGLIITMKYKGCSTMPKLSVIIPVYKTEASQLIEALSSVFVALPPDSEIHIGFDGEYDENGLNMLESLRKRSGLNKVRLSKFKRQGLVSTLNALVEQSDCLYLARHDGDDICMPQRLKQQLSAMESTTLQSFCGTQITRCDSALRPHRMQRKYPLTLEGQLIYASLINNPIAHPTLMIRRHLLENYRYEDIPGAEDWDLYIRLWRAGHRSFNLKETGLLYRIHPGQVTQQNRKSTLLKELKKRSFEVAMQHNTSFKLLKPLYCLSNRVQLSEHAIRAKQLLSR